jgi:hypothetical protein
MKITVEKLRKFIKEELSAPLGQYAWPKERKLPVEEPNTAVEDELKQSIIEAILDVDRPLSGENAKLIFDLLKKRMYEDVIKAPSVGTVYRGVGFTREKLASVIGEEPSSMGAISISLSYKPVGTGSSWSKSERIASSFARRFGARKPDFSVLFVALTRENREKFVDFEELYNLNDDVKGSAFEREVFGYGEITISRVIWASKEEIAKNEDVLLSLSLI